MTPQRLDEIKAIIYHLADAPVYDASLEPISALEESQRIPELIVKIFEAGGDLKDLAYFAYEGEELYYRVRDCNGVLSLARFNLSSALEFILERITK